MISVTKINGSRVYLNAELIETVEATPDTVITLMNDRKFIVRENAEEIIERVIEYQRKVHQPFTVDHPKKENFQDKG
jgi:flagellar protein FlbD